MCAVEATHLVVRWGQYVVAATRPLFVAIVWCFRNPYIWLFIWAMRNVQEWTLLFSVRMPQRVPSIR